LSFTKVEPPAKVRLSDSIVSHIEQMIVDGTLKPGDSLPPERELASMLDVSRPSLREAIVKLEAKGLVQSGRGGGMQVVDVYAPTLTDPLVDLLWRHPSAAFDVLELRHALEQLAAFHAAARATDVERRQIETCMTRFREASKGADPIKIAECDAAFHLAIADASHNVALSYVMRGLVNLLRTSISNSLERFEPDVLRRLDAQHAAICTAVGAGDADQARQAAHAHLTYVQSMLRRSDDGSGRGSSAHKLASAEPSSAAGAGRSRRRDRAAAAESSADAPGSGALRLAQTRVAGGGT
jgi:GntR family transcriptional regulator, transcriptional repressor for pyruvate dehydrogenase complex